MGRYLLSLPRLDHNGTFSPDDLAGLRAEFDALCGLDAGDCTLQAAARSYDYAVRVGNTFWSPQHLRVSFRPAKATLARSRERDAVRSLLKTISEPAPAITEASRNDNLQTRET